MNQLLLFITVLVIFVYFGGSNVPKVLRDNKQIFLGVIVGLFLCNSMGLRLEGFANQQQCEDAGCGADPCGKWQALNDDCSSNISENSAQVAAMFGGQALGTVKPLPALDPSGHH